MEAVKKISEKLNDCMVRNDDLKIEQWHFTFEEGRIISLGLDSNEIGGPYSPPATKDAYRGSAYIRWADGKVSDVNITTESLEDLDSAMKEWKSASYYDKDAVEVTEPVHLPENLKLKDERIVDLVMKDSSYFFEILDFYKRELGKKDYAKIIEGQIAADYLNTVIMNSKGFNTAWEETDIQLYAYVNSIAGDAYTKRTLPEKKDLNKIIKEIDRYMIHSKRVLNVKSGIMPIILTPEVLGSFLGMFILSNLQGGTVSDNQSLYSIEDFKTKRQVFDEKINVTIDGLKEYSVSAQPCSGEGVPSTKQHLIADGRLITPTLDRKYAKKTGMQPTSTGEVSLEIEHKVSYNSMIKGVDYGLIIYGVLGMHTQDPKTGEYSLAVDQGLVIQNGKVTGKVKNAAIKGKFFEALKDKNTKFAEYRKDEMAMLTEAKVIA